MDFHQLLARMQELDRPAEMPAEEGCGMSPSMPSSMPSAQSDVPPPSLSVNINAQGMDNIEDIMKLITKVNPDAAPKSDMPSLSAPPSIMSIKPAMPPLKMLPDFDADNDDMPGGEKDDAANDPIMKMDLDKDDDEGSQPGDLGASLDRDGDGDHDMDDHDMEPDSNDEEDEEDKKEAWDNEPNEEEKDIDYMVNKLAGGMNKSHDTYPKVSDGDNPMQKVREETDLKDQIKAELRKRLAEAKGVK